MSLPNVHIIFHIYTCIIHVLQTQDSVCILYTVFSTEGYVYTLVPSCKSVETGKRNCAKYGNANVLSLVACFVLHVTYNVYCMYVVCPQTPDIREQSAPEI